MTSRVRLVALFLLGSMSWLSCSDPKQGSAGSTGASGTGGASAGAEANDAGSPVSVTGGAGGEPAAQACNTLELAAPPFNLTTDPGPAPDATGGKLVDGTYFATAEVLYDTATPMTLEFGRLEVVIAGDSWQEVSADDIDPNRHTTSTLSVAGSTLDLTGTCPSNSQDSFEYSVDDTGFTLYLDDHGSTFGTVFTRQ